MLKKLFYILVGTFAIALISCRDTPYHFQITRNDPPLGDVTDPGDGDSGDDDDSPEDISGASTTTKPTPVGEVEFPLTMSFRAEETIGDGVLTGLENFDFIHTGSKDTVNAFLENSSFDNKKVFFHGSFAAASANYYNRIYAGHWLFEPGTTLTASASTSATTLHVADAGLFEVGDYCMISYRDSTGSRLWDTVEEVVVSSVNTTSNKIVVERAQFETTANSWDISVNTIVITPHVYMTPQSISQNWMINVALGSPKNTDGQEGWEFFGQWVYDIFWVEKMSSEGDGIQLDSARWVYDNTKFPVDFDNDGNADYGFKDGVNVFGLGAAKAIAEIRRHLPAGAILQLDSSAVEDGYRDPTYVNGIEMESFPAIDNYKQYSAARNHLFQWVSQTKNYESLSYPFTKDDTAAFQCDPSAILSDDEDLEINNYFRIGFATALLSGSTFSYAAETSVSGKKCFDGFIWDEYKGGSLEDWHWLGKPYGNAIQDFSDLGETDYLSDAEWTASDKNSSLPSTTNPYEYTAYAPSSEKLILNVSKVPQTIVERSNETLFPGVDGVSIDTTSTLSTGSHSAYTIKFSAKAKNTYNDDSTYSEFSDIPRLLGIRISTPTTAYRLSALVWEEKQDFVLSFRLDTPEPVESVSFQSGEETGTVTIENIKLYSGSAERWVRYFEGGAVILNMSPNEWNAELDNFYSSTGFSRLSGSQDPEVNSAANGEGSAFTKFTAPAFDAFLVKIRE